MENIPERRMAFDAIVDSADSTSSKSGIVLKQLGMTKNERCKSAYLSEQRGLEVWRRDLGYNYIDVLVVCPKQMLDPTMKLAHDHSPDI